MASDAQAPASQLYDSLDPTLDEFRLLRILSTKGDTAQTRLTLTKHSLNDPPRYRAISYVCGDQSIRETISVNDHDLNAPRTSLEVLPFLQTRDVPLWIDAICINESDKRERAQQVQAMRRIFGQAELVLIWLGPPSNIIRVAFEFIEAWSSLSIGEITKDMDNFEEQYPCAFDENAWSAFKAFVSHEWFQRIWTYQELVVSKFAFFVCGNHILAFDKAWEALNNAEETVNHQMSMGDLRHFSYVLQGPTSTLSMMTWHSRKHKARVGGYLPDNTTSNGASLRRLQVMLHNLKATDPRDKIYALPDMYTEHGFTVVPDYDKSISEVYLEFAVHCTQKDRSLAIIALGGIGIRLEEQAPKLDLPSWVPDLRESARWPVSFMLGSAMPETFSQSFCLSADNRTLRVSGVDYTVATGFLVRDVGHMSIGTWMSFIKTFTVPHPTGVTQIQAFIRTMFVDTIGGVAPDFLFVSEAKKKEFFDYVIGFMYLVGVLAQDAASPNDLMKFQQYLDSCEGNADYASQFSAWTTGCSTSQGRLTDAEMLAPFTGTLESEVFMEWPHDMYQTNNNLGSYGREFLLKCTQVTWGRVFFWAESGYIGLGPELMQKGDRLCVIQGFDGPLLVRKVQERYYLVGACYVFGLMKGETEEHIRSNKVEVISFELS